MYLLKRIFILVLLSGFLAGCEYGLDKENFIEVEKPSETHPFDLSLLSGEDTIKVFDYAEIAYDLNTFGLEIQAGIFTLGDKTWNISGSKGSIFISPADYEPGFDTLTLKLFTETGTNSIASQLGAESYVAEKKWLVLIENRPTPNIKLSYSITPEGFLKLSWPKCELYNFSSYRLLCQTENHNSLGYNFFDINRTYFIDSSYVGGKMSCLLVLYVFGPNGNSYGENLIINETKPIPLYEEIGVDSLRIYWQKVKFNARYKLSVQNSNPLNILLDSETDTSITIPSPGFAKSITFDLETTPVYPNGNLNYYFLKTFSRYMMGVHFLPNWPNYGYNQLQNIVYSNRYDVLQAYNPLNMNMENSVYVNDIIYAGMYSCPTNSTKIAALSNEFIQVFADKSLQNPVTIPFSWGSYADHFCFTNNDLLAVAKSGMYTQIRISDQQEVASFAITDYPYYSKWACIATSNDGKYVAVVTKNGGIVHKIENGVVSQVHSDQRVYRSAIFNENNNRQLFLTFFDSNSIEIRDPSDFSLIKSISLPVPSAVLCNIDPVSGYLLVTDYESLYLVDIENASIKLKISSDDFKPRLFNKRLFSNSGVHFDISKYIN